MKEASNYFARNNFDLIRLLAAGQVLLVHGVEHMRCAAPQALTEALSAFPGVPAFFFISGFLITAAWERNPDVAVFYLNRFHRIFPGLWVCVLLSAVALFAAAGTSDAHLPPRQLLPWIIAQGSIMQAWNPKFLAWFGVGVVNGSLWTIPVEIAFYVAVPILYWLCRGRTRDLTTALVVVAAGSFATLYSLSYWNPDTSGVAFMKKAVRISPLPWMGMFCLGALAQRYIHIIYPVVAGRFLLFLAIFIAAAVVGWLLGTPVLFGSGNVIGIVNYLTLCLMVMAAAYTGRAFSDRALMRNDLSYGTYIYHMPVFNVLIQIGIRGPIGLALGVGLTFALSALSWWLVEKPALRRRKSVLYAR